LAVLHAHQIPQVGFHTSGVGREVFADVQNSQWLFLGNLFGHGELGASIT
jgi:hypothetical protein